MKPPGRNPKEWAARSMQSYFALHGIRLHIYAYLKLLVPEVEQALKPFDTLIGYGPFTCEFYRFLRKNATHPEFEISAPEGMPASTDLTFLAQWRLIEANEGAVLTMMRAIEQIPPQKRFSLPLHVYEAKSAPIETLCAAWAELALNPTAPT